MKDLLKLGILVFFLLFLTLSCSTKKNSFSAPSWREHTPNPVINYEQTLTGIIWNDPSVMKENGTYRMWLSGGTGLGINHVKIYEATSTDGISWTIDPTVLLEPSPTTGAWDDEKTETPMVVKAGGIYHLYYSGFKTGDNPGQYQIGHATSPDGKAWTKDPANPIITYHLTSTKWGFYQVAEPGVVYDSTSGTFYLYYVTAKARPGYTGDLALQQGIALATSTDGSSFSNYDPDVDGELNPVLVQSAHYPVTSNYVGYSTPYGLIDSSGTFHLFYDVAQYPVAGDWRQVALAHATSTDGKNFTEVETDIFVYNQGDWKRHEVRAPCVLQEGSIFKMWFAGNNELFFQPGFVIGIGYATWE